MHLSITGATVNGYKVVFLIKQHKMRVSRRLVVRIYHITYRYLLKLFKINT